MYYSQVLFAFRGLRMYSGQSLPELAESIRNEWGQYEAVQWLLLDDRTDRLKRCLSDLGCVEVRDGRYFFNSKSERLVARADDRALEFLLKRDMEHLPMTSRDTTGD